MNSGTSRRIGLGLAALLGAWVALVHANTSSAATPAHPASAAPAQADPAKATHTHAAPAHADAETEPHTDAAAPAPDASSAADRAENDDDDRADHRDRFDGEDKSDDWYEHFDWNKGTERRGPHAHRDAGSDVINIGHDSHLAVGDHADSVVSVFGSSTSEGDADDVVSVLGDTRVTAGTVKDSAVAVLGDTYVDSAVDGDVVAVLGTVELGPHAVVKGDAVAVGGEVKRDAKAVLHGDAQSIGGAVISFGWLKQWVNHCLLYGRPLALVHGIGWAWSLAIGFWVFYVILALLFPQGVVRCARTLETQPGSSIVASLLTVLFIPLLFVLLCVTVIGIAAIPFLMLALAALGLFGKTVMLAWIGRRCVGGHREGALGHPAAAVLVGGAIVLALYLVPVVGFLVYKLLGLLGLGTVAYALITVTRESRTAKPGAPFRGAGPAGDFSPTGVPPEMAMPSTGPGAVSQGAAAQAAATGESTAAAAAAEPGAAGAAGTNASAGAGTKGAQVPPMIAVGLPRAGFWIRMLALLLDTLLMGILLSVLHQHHLELLALAAYGAVMWKLRGTTVGGIVFDLQVVRLDGRPMNWETAILRALSCFLSLVVAGLGFFWIAFDQGKQAWHDKIAGTAVVRVASAMSMA